MKYNENIGIERCMNMNNFEKLYTIEDIANMTRLTSRTIRNYLKDGILEGKKIGGQWRFTMKDNKRQFLVLVIVLPDIDVISVGGTVVERFALNLGLLVGALPADIAVFDQFFLDLHEIVFRECNIE